MATASSSTSLYAPSGSTAWTLKAEWTQGSQDIANNKTSITVKASLKSSQGSFSGGGGTLYIDWYDNNNGWQTGKASKSTTSMSAGSSISCSKTFDVTHKADGTLSGYARARWSKNSNNWVPASGSVSNSSKALTTIPRASVPTVSAASVALGNAVTIYTNRKASTYTHTIWIQAGGLSKTQLYTGIQTSQSWTPNATQIASIMSGSSAAKSFTATVTLRTYNGSTQIGSDQTCTFTYTVPNTYKPTLSSWTITEGNTNISSLLSSADDVVKILSQKNISITATPQNSATVTKVTATNGNKTITLTKSGNVFSGTFTDLQAVGFSISATDSRGFVTTQSYGTSATLISYVAPQITDIKVDRTTSKSSIATLKVDGQWFTGSIGSTSNTLTLQYNWNNEETNGNLVWNDVSATAISATPFSITNNSISTIAVYTSDFQVNVRIKDTFQNVIQTFTITLPSSRTVLWVGKNTVRVNEHFVVEGDEPSMWMCKFEQNNDRTYWEVPSGYLGSVTAGGSASFTLPDSATYEIIAISTFKSQTIKWIVIPNQSTACFHSEGYGQWNTTDLISFTNSSTDSTATNYKFYNDTAATFNKINGITAINFQFTAKATEGSTGAKRVGWITKEFLRPQSLQRFVVQGSSENRLLMEINTSGQINVARYGYGTSDTVIPKDVWIVGSWTYVSRSYPALVDVTDSVNNVITVTSLDKAMHVFYRRLGRLF